MIVTNDILDDPRLENGKLYIWESTMSGRLGGGVPDINGRTYLGVQLRDFDEVFKFYDQNPETRVAWCSLKNNPSLSPNFKSSFTTVFNKYNGSFYNANIFSLLASLFPYLRPLRYLTEIKHIDSSWLFCSELVATVYRDLGIFPQTVNPENVVPVDFLPYVTDFNNAPKVIDSIMYIIYDNSSLIYLDNDPKYINLD